MPIASWPSSTPCPGVGQAFQGASFGSTKLDLRVTECGRGLATAPIEEGEVCSVPWKRRST